MKTIFITSTGTDIGKTIFISSLIKKLKSLGEEVFALKPVVSGFDIESVPNDISSICESIEVEYNPQSVDTISCYRFLAPLSPDQAAKKEGKKIDFEVLKNFCLERADCKYKLIEAVGGLYVPFDKKHTVMDLMRKVNADVNILVAGSYLGSISHTLSAIKNFDAEGVKLDLLVVTENLEQRSDLYIPSEDTIKSIRNFYKGNILEIKHKKGSFSDVITQISEEINYEF